MILSPVRKRHGNGSARLGRSRGEGSRIFVPNLSLSPAALPYPLAFFPPSLLLYSSRHDPGRNHLPAPVPSQTGSIAHARPLRQHLRAASLPCRRIAQSPPV